MARACRGFTVITLFAVANTALINYITASRLIYGIARQGLLPARLGTVHSSGRTPHLAIGLLLLVLMLLALLTRSPSLQRRRF